MTVIYRLLEINNEIKEEYFKSIAGVAAAALVKYKEYLLSRDLLYTEGLNPPDITEESLEKLLADAKMDNERYAIATIVSINEYTISLMEIELHD